jgi:hypothetical protein
MNEIKLIKFIYKLSKNTPNSLTDLKQFKSFLEDDVYDLLGDVDIIEDTETIAYYFQLIQNNIESLKNGNLNSQNFVPVNLTQYTVIYSVSFSETGIYKYKTIVNSPNEELASQIFTTDEKDGNFDWWSGEELSKETFDSESFDVDVRSVYTEGTKLSKLKKTLTESSDSKAFLPQEVYIFRTIQKQLKELKTKDKIIGRIKEILDYMGFDPLESMYYYYLFTSNFREDGRYDLTKESEKKGPQDLKAQKTKNTNVGPFAQSKIPFKGSNLEGFWEKDLDGVDQYIITSYGWYPIYIFKKGQWYKINDTYSSSTGRHVSNTQIGYDKPLFNKSEMNALRAGVSPEKLLSNKYEKLVQKLKNELIGRKFTRSIDFYSLGWNRPEMRNMDNRGGKIDFIVQDVDLVDGKPELTIDILRGGFTTPTRAYLSTTYAHPSLFSEGAEMTVDREMKALLYHELLKRDDLMIKINHPNSKPQETEIVNSME